MEGYLEAQKIGQALNDVTVKDLTGHRCPNRAFRLVKEGDYPRLRFQGSKAWSPCYIILKQARRTWCSAETPLPYKSIYHLSRPGIGFRSLPH